MSTGSFPPASEEGSFVSAPSFRSKQRKVLHLLLEKNTSFTIRSDFPESPGDRLHNSANLSILSGGTPKCCLDLSNLSNGEMSASQLTTSADLEENAVSLCSSGCPGTHSVDQAGLELRKLPASASPSAGIKGSLDLSGPQDVQLTGKDFHQDLMKGIPVQLLCSTPHALDPGHRRKGAKRSTSARKENINTSLKTLEWEAPRTPRFRKMPGDPLASPLCEAEMKYLGSPITTVPKLSQNRKPEDQEGISEDAVECSLEDRDAKGLSLKKMVPLCDMNTIRMEEEESDSELLIGDFSKVCVLPTVPGKHPDLKYISPDTVFEMRSLMASDPEPSLDLPCAGITSRVAALLSGKFQSEIERFYIIDCRYPYEYLGGHILGALNLHSPKELHEFFLRKPVVPLDLRKRVIIVFLCEFSSERGPRMCRSLREKDRALNQYPALYYPELYILKGGYRDFFPEYMELCEPQNYCPMLHLNHQAELLSWRSQSRAEAGERQLQEQIALLVKGVSPR
ncbi:M-phase inducer phosphatase 3 [Apodemus speciosus]|uniref:M-phase inducer phosphatase n=1 Tax=Apodemus speciosus TaxID=105296 RepID=A0ABQ0FQM1_APOSI